MGSSALRGLLTVRGCDEAEALGDRVTWLDTPETGCTETRYGDMGGPEKTPSILQVRGRIGLSQEAVLS